MEDAPEWKDGAADPVDRWSTRVISDWAAALGATPLFPFDGPPFQPFFRWAVRTGRIHSSPIRLLVQDEVGLFVSFRGALALRETLALPPAPPSPCLTCRTQPCRTVCPVTAFDGQSYDVPRCKTHITGPDDLGCRNLGCGARRACPISQGSGRLPSQSAYHMERFLDP